MHGGPRGFSCTSCHLLSVDMQASDSGLCEVARSLLFSSDMKTTVTTLRYTVNQDNSADAADQLSFDITTEADIPTQG